MASTRLFPGAAPSAPPVAAASRRDRALIIGCIVFCLGCCWALMGVLLVVGVMNLTWVGVLTVFILLEKIGPAGLRLARVGGAMLIAFGVVLVSR